MRGPGRVQQTITELIQSNPHGAWTVPQICERLYPGMRVEMRHRAAVRRALRYMELPGTWSISPSHPKREYCLYDKCDEESALRQIYFAIDVSVSFAAWKQNPDKSSFWIEHIRKEVSTARRHRDGSPMEKLDIEIAELNHEKDRYGGSGRYADACRKQIAELVEKKKALEQARANIMTRAVPWC
jgi:hypothetical protein